MIKRLQRKFVLVVMVVVTLILLSVFLTMLVSTQRDNERMSEGMLLQALSRRPAPYGNSGFQQGNLPPGGDMRLPVLVLSVDENNEVSAVSNQLHFIETEQIEPIADLVLAQANDTGILRAYTLRYLRRPVENGFLVALADISLEQEMLNTQIVNSLVIGGVALLAFFFLSIILARWAVRPVEAAWANQTQFIADASHELKTPLTVILSNADMLRTVHEGHDEQSQRRLEHIHAEAVRMKQLVESLLMLAQSDSLEVRETHSAVDFSYLVQSAVLVYEPIVFDAGKSLTYSIDKELIVLGDAAKLQQAVHILLDNAMKYSHVKGKLQVSLFKVDAEALLLRVDDEGDPIPKAELERIFLRFYRRDEARSEASSFGLGLSIAQSIVWQHHGKIWAESDGELCNSFHMRLPLS